MDVILTRTAGYRSDGAGVLSPKMYFNKQDDFPKVATQNWSQNKVMPLLVVQIEETQYFSLKKRCQIFFYLLVNCIWVQSVRIKKPIYASKLFAFLGPLCAKFIS